VDQNAVLKFEQLRKEANDEELLVLRQPKLYNVHEYSDSYAADFF